MPIWRRKVGSAVTSAPSMKISPPSGSRKPATRLSSVVLPHPDGPSRERSSPRFTLSQASSSARVVPKCLLTPSSWTAMSASGLDIEHLAEAEESIGNCDQGRCHHDEDDRERRHGRIGIFAHIVVHGDRQGLGL